MFSGKCTSLSSSSLQKVKLLSDSSDNSVSQNMLHNGQPRPRQALKELGLRLDVIFYNDKTLQLN